MSIQITVLGFEPTTFTTWVSSLNRASQYTFLKDNEGKRDTKKEIREEIWRGEIKKCNKELAWQFDENSKNVKWNPLYDKSPFLLLSKNWLKLSGNNSVAKVVVVVTSSSSLENGFLSTIFPAMFLILSKPLLIEFRNDAFVGSTVGGGGNVVWRLSASQMWERWSHAAKMDLSKRSRYYYVI